MLCVLPADWETGRLIPDERLLRREPGATCADAVRAWLCEDDPDGLLLLGADGVGEKECWLLASDHVSLFGDGPLVGEDDRLPGPRFPSLRGLYLSPEGPWNRGVVGKVPDWRLATPAELDCLGAEAMVSDGIDEAVMAGRGGRRVALMVRVSAWGRRNLSRPPLEKLLRAPGFETSTEGGEEL
ncbi:hypothetical protein JW921_00195 [Candidatus Fermentibacterales bacterium]|nr:hypothetical protein [Candidatus Fermentibacterales bacterium]